MRGILRLAVASALAVGGSPLLADCVSCGPGGECFTVSSGFSGNCACVIRSAHGVAICKPSGVCDPSDANTCSDNPFPQSPTKRRAISTRFLPGLEETNPFLAGAVWAGLADLNAAPAATSAVEVEGTMGRDGKSYRYRIRVETLGDAAVSVAVHVQEDGAEQGQDYEGTLARGGRSGRFDRVGVKKERAAVFAWRPEEGEK